MGCKCAISNEEEEEIKKMPWRMEMREIPKMILIKILNKKMIYQVSIIKKIYLKNKLKIIMPIYKSHFIKINTRILKEGKMKIIFIIMTEMQNMQNTLKNLSN